MPDAPVEMAESDCEEVLSFWRDMPGVGLSDADTREGLIRFFHRNPGLSLVVRDEGKIVGAVLCGHDGRRGYLHHLAVDPKYRRQGIGNALVEECIARLSSLKIQKCNIFIYSNNQDGIGFWQGNGWFERQDLNMMQRVIHA